MKITSRAHVLLLGGLLASASLLVAALQLPESDGKNVFSGQASFKPPTDYALRDEAGRPLYFVQLVDEPGIFTAARTMNTMKADGAVRQSKRLANRIAAPDVMQYRTALTQKQDDTLAAVQKVGGRAIHVVSRNNLLVNGFTVHLGKREVEFLRGQAGVKSVSVVTPRYPETDHGPEFIGARSIWEGLDGGMETRGEGVIVGIIDTGIDPHSRSFADIGDDGYDHTNPLGNGVYLGDCEKPEYANLCNDKLIGIVSYPEITQYNAPRHDPVGLDLVGHGTHVASTAAGNELHDVPIYDYINGEESDFSMPRISGVAPHANIISYQICHTYMDGNGEPIEGGPCLTHLTVTALEHAVEHGVDVINYSIGGAADDPWIEMDTLAFLNARAAGVHAATSAGNSGPGESTVGGPANAPWILSVAAGSHDRVFEGKILTNFSGGLTTPPDIAGAGLSSGVHAPVVSAADYGDAECNTNFPAGTFRGEIVVCRRGAIPRIDKGRVLRDAGADGMILINVDLIINDLVDDPHLLPAIQISYEDGVELLDWLSAGTNHMAEITASRLGSDPAAADLVADFSSRGPNRPYPEIPAIHVLAPGVDVFAAYSFDRDMMGSPDPEIPFNSLSGTSMASPHVAGALALLASRHPDWSPAEAQSAVMMTADPSGKVIEIQPSGERLEVPAGLNDQGAGSIRINRAVNAGLLLDIAKEDYEAANPNTGGDLTALNFPALMSEACVFKCEWTREFRATVDTTWTVELDSDDPEVSLVASPASFTVRAGDHVAVEFVFEIGVTSTKPEYDAAVRLVPADKALAELRLPLHVKVKAGDAPKNVEITTHRSSGRFEIPNIRSLGTAKDITIAVGGISAGQKYVAETIEDETPELLYDDWQSPWHWVELDVERGARYLSARIVSPDAPDLDLYCILDNDNDGHHDIVELQAPYSAYSAGPDSDEFCEIHDPQAGHYFIGVHNFKGSGAEKDRHELEVQVVNGDDESNLAIDPIEPFDPLDPYKLTGTWDFDMSADESSAAVITLGTSVDTPDNIGSVLVTFRRGPDDVSLVPDRTVAAPGELINYSLNILGNESDIDRAYNISLPLPADVEMVEQDGSATVAGGMMQWTLVQAAGAAQAQHSFAVRANSTQPYLDIVLSAEHVMTEGAFVSSKEVAKALEVSVELAPIALIGGEPEYQTSVTAGDTVILDGNASTGVRPDDELSFQWAQLSGPAAVLADTEQATLQFAAPAVSSQQTLEFELLVNNGRNISVPAKASITVSPKPVPPGGKSGGGALAWLMLLLTAFGMTKRWTGRKEKLA